MRNPKWHRDEIILALDLYFQLEPGQIHGRNPAVIELSEVLNRLPIFDVRPDEAKFRNPNGVGLKLSNFLAIDPSYTGKGMQSFSKLDKEVFLEFFQNQIQLRKIANAIRTTVSNSSLTQKLYLIPEEVDEKDIVFTEGKVLYKLHRYRERDNKLITLKKKTHLKKYGSLDCEACDFNFQVKYGDLGTGFIECHHRTPLYDYEDESETSLKDLALVCSNCHRMLHRSLHVLDVGDIRNILRN
ncbi:HNH endonuclease [Litoribacter alkaliphilus]|uniref:HNH endonuclease n=1 Tax=Litoribacter ruber TaxID=702568 RepID=A0AAP2CNM5_9BACT|nr:HNH endonuclease [Litoribacter alkaliphilus]MBS9525855.1 HNH endonuclease [Litoribacter alkaliphilus]